MERVLAEQLVRACEIVKRCECAVMRLVGLLADREVMTGDEVRTVLLADVSGCDAHQGGGDQLSVS